MIVQSGLALVCAAFFSRDSVQSPFLRGLSPVRTLNVAYPSYWGNLEPALQHTAYADELLANEFEPLVREGAGGAIVPGLAESWVVSQDFRRFTFRLREGVRFSDGTVLTASMVKSSWEEGLRLQPKSANSSLQDVLYLVQGYNEFNLTGALTGIRVDGARTIHVDFVRPFRTALTEFATGRMSIFNRVNGRALGTGPYVIQSSDPNRLRLIRNPHFLSDEGFAEVSIVALPQTEAAQAVSNGQIDVYAFANADSLASCAAGPSQIHCHHGNESKHVVADLNGLPGRLFSDIRHRLAFQYLVHSALKQQNRLDRLFASASIDPQPYLPLQSGRLPDARAHELLERGAPFVERFLAAARASPLYVMTSPSTNEFLQLLVELGVATTRSSGQVELEERLRNYYQTFGPDVITGGSSVSSGDPDGLFHVLASDGAIASPMIIRPRVSRLLQDGRSITNLELLPAHYSLVSEAVLEEVPFVHLGFGRNVYVYNRSRVRPVDSVPGREARSLLSFVPVRDP